MYFYLKSISEDNLGIPTTVSVCTEKDIIGNYKNIITDNSFYSDSKPIMLKLDYWKGRSMELRDFHIWGIGSPDTYNILASPKFMKVLNKLKIPNYRYYHAKILHDNREYKYYVLHFQHDYLNDIDYSKSEFYVSEILETNPIIEKCLQGKIHSYKYFEDINTKLLNEMKWLYSKKIHFKDHINHDIWGLRGQIIISQKAKQAIQEAKISGVEMPNIKDTDMFSYLEVEMPGLDLVLQE